MWEGPLCPDPLRCHNSSGHKGPSHIGATTHRGTKAPPTLVMPLNE